MLLKCWYHLNIKHLCITHIYCYFFLRQTGNWTTADLLTSINHRPQTNSSANLVIHTHTLKNNKHNCDFRLKFEPQFRNK